MVRRRAETFEPVTMGHIRGRRLPRPARPMHSGRCYHSATMNADWLSDETPVRSLCRRMVCTKCALTDRIYPRRGALHYTLPRGCAKLAHNFVLPHTGRSMIAPPPRRPPSKRRFPGHRLLERQPPVPGEAESHSPVKVADPRKKRHVSQLAMTDGPQPK